MKRKTTVTHPNGAVSTRTSESKIYTHAVVISRSRESLVNDALERAANREAHADEYAAAVDGEITETERDWSYGKRYITLYVGGMFGDAHVSDQPRPSDEDLREKLRRRESEERAAAKKCRDEAEELASGPEMTYGVLRWSSRADLAAKAASGEFAALVRDGVKVYVVEVDNR